MCAVVDRFADDGVYSVTICKRLMYVFVLMLLFLEEISDLFLFTTAIFTCIRELMQFVYCGEHFLIYVLF